MIGGHSWALVTAGWRHLPRTIYTTAASRPKQQFIHIWKPETHEKVFLVDRDIISNFSFWFFFPGCSSALHSAAAAAALEGGRCMCGIGITYAAAIVFTCDLQKNHICMCVCIAKTHTSHATTFSCVATGAMPPDPCPAEAYCRFLSLKVPNLLCCLPYGSCCVPPPMGSSQQKLHCQQPFLSTSGKTSL